MLEHWANAGAHPDDGACRRDMWTALHRFGDQVADLVEQFDDTAKAAEDKLSSGRP